MDTASDIWNRFVRLPGAAVDGIVGIGSMNAIHGLIRTIRGRKPGRILEIGSGVGTLTYTITMAQREFVLGQERVFYTVENHPFCIGQMAENLSGLEGCYIRVGAVEDIPAAQEFDLIVVDGGGDLANDMGIMSFEGRLAKHGAVFVEGARGFQRSKVEQWYGNRRHVYVKMQSFQPIVPVLDKGWRVKNKPYHLFIFEPGPIEENVLRVQGLVNDIGVRAVRRLRRKGPREK